MRKVLLTLNSFDENSKEKEIFNKYINPNFKAYADKWGFEYVVITENLRPCNHIHWSKILWILDNWESFNDNDVITYIDSDCYIMNNSIDFVFNKNFAIPIESTGIVCAGFFSIKICDFCHKFLIEMLNTMDKCNPYFNDNHAIYLVRGLEMGMEFKSDGNFNVLPINYNVTIMPDELTDSEIDVVLKTHYKEELYVPMDKIIIRHFAAGQIYQNKTLKYFK